MALALGSAGAALRWSGIGSFGFSNDEAWVALATRVEGFGQFWLAIAMTPIGWAALVKAAALAHGSETSLRLVPFLWGCLALGLAWRAGARFAGHALGGALALAVLAFDPLGIGYAKVLKQYTAEVCLALLALDRAAVAAASGARRDLAVVVLVLAGGLVFSNAQLLMAPPVLAALALDALVARRYGRVRDVVVAAAAVACWNAVYHATLVAPRLPAADDAYWRMQQYLPATLEAAQIGWHRLAWNLGPVLGGTALVPAMLALVAGCFLARQRVAALALVLLVAEIAGLSMRGLVPVSQPRVLLFVTSALAAYGAAGLGGWIARAARRPAGALVAAAVLAFVAWDFAAAHPWRRLRAPMFVEDAGPLVRTLFRDRRPGDAVLLHQNTLFIFAYYRPAVPVLIPSRGASTGYLPAIRDPAVVLVNDRTLPALAEKTWRTRRRGWFLASRLARERERRLRSALDRGATTLREQRRRGAVLLLLEARPA